MRRPPGWLAGLALLAAAQAACAQPGPDNCVALATRDVPAGDPPSTPFKAGALKWRVSQYRVPLDGGAPTYCSHGGTCEPADAFRLFDCRTGALIASDGDGRIYVVEPIPSKAPQLRRIWLLLPRLGRLGLGDDCAWRAAWAAVETPRSPCANLTRAALDGDRKAVQALSQPHACR